MLVDHVSLLNPNDTQPIQTWLDSHPTAVIERIVTVEFHFYIFYTDQIV
jgi:hypothetical protein